MLVGDLLKICSIREGKMFCKLLSIVFMLVFVVSSAVAQSDTYTINFDGYSGFESNPDSVGSVMEIYGTAATSECPFPMDSENFEYTAVVTGLVVESFEWDQTNRVKTLVFSGGTLSIYEDSETTADYANRETLSDGTLFLQSNIANGWQMTLDDGLDNGVYSGFAGGTCEFIAGSSLSQIMDSGLPNENWNFNGLSISDPSFFFSVPDGYHRFCDLLITSPTDFTSNNSVTWGHMKTLFSN